MWLFMLVGLWMQTGLSVEIQGHRGTATRTENTLQAFIQGYAEGADSVECDVQVSADNVVFLAHDPYIRRNDQIYGVCDYSYQEYQELAGDAKQDRRFALLQDALRLLKTDELGNKILDIEIKYDERYTKSPVELACHVWSVIQASGVASRNLRVRSFDPEVIVAMQHLAPTIPLIYLTYDVVDWAEQAYRLKVFGVAPWKKTVTAPLVQSAHAFGLYVIPYTVNVTQEIQDMIECGVDGITTDYPQDARRYVISQGARCAKL